MTAQPPDRPSNQPAEGNPPTQPIPAAENSPAAGPPAGPPAAPPAGWTAAPMSAGPPKATAWRRATATNGGRWALGIAAGALALLLFLGVGIAGILILRPNDRVDLLGNRQDRHSLDQDGNGNRKDKGKGNREDRENDNGSRHGQGPGANDGKDRQKPPGMRGMPGGRAHGLGGLGGLGNLLDGTALHGEVTVNANGSVQQLVFQRGEVTASSATSLTLKSSDGFTGTYGLTDATDSRGANAVKGGQAFVLARASDKVAITTMAAPATAAAAPSS